MVPLLALAVNVGCAEAPAPRGSQAAHEERFEAPARAAQRAGVPVRGLRAPSITTTRLSEHTPSPWLSLAATDTVLDAVTEPVRDAALSDAPSDRLDAAFDAAREDGRNPLNLGLSALTSIELFGDAFTRGACEPLEADMRVEFEGEAWEIGLYLPYLTMFVGEPDPQEMPLDEACAAALLTHAGDLDAAEGDGCTDLQLEQFFPEGSECRACVEANGGDFDTCVDRGACPEEAAYVVSADGEDGPSYWNVAAATMVACKPDYTFDALLLTQISPDGSFPDAFDPDGWGLFCVPVWSEALGAVDYLCPGIGGTLAQGVWPGIRAMHPADAPSTDIHLWRAAYTPRIGFDSGDEVRWSWNFPDGVGVISHDPEYPDTNEDGAVDTGDMYTGFGTSSGWGLNPYALRPDGADPDSLDDTYARDYVAAYAVKTATTRSGVLVAPYNHSRCDEDAWEGPDADGSWRCTATTAPAEGWLNDANATFTNPYQMFAIPTATVGSTGLADPDIPGGIVPLIAGSPTLAAATFDDCALPNQFVPDQIGYPDTAPDWDGPNSLVGDTWRFGAHPELDLRVVLNTNVARNWCDDGAPR